MKKAYDKYPDFDMFVGFEPMPDLYKKTKKRFASYKKISIKRYAAGTRSEDDIKLYVNWVNEEERKIGKGSSLFADKTSGGINKDKYVMVDVIDFSEYLVTHFKSDDFIILKVDVEGEEYDLLEHLIKTGSISFINELYCEWHWHKIANDNINEDRHDKLIKKLNEFGFGLTGDNSKDEYDKVF
jgi:FkbM family methyltransferase